MNNNEDLITIKNAVRNIPDFPQQGIQFKDITTAIKQPHIYSLIIDQIASYYAGKGITKVVAVESRGFISGGALAYKLHAGLVPVRKPGKLPAEKYSRTYELEYGQDILEIHKDALSSEDIVLLHDDLLATGGTALAVIELLKLFHVKTIYINFIIELVSLKGKQRLPGSHDLYTLIQY